MSISRRSVKVFHYGEDSSKSKRKNSEMVPNIFSGLPRVQPDTDTRSNRALAQRAMRADNSPISLNKFKQKIMMPDSNYAYKNFHTGEMQSPSISPSHAQSCSQVTRNTIFQPKLSEILNQDLVLERIKPQVNQREIDFIQQRLDESAKKERSPKVSFPLFKVTKLDKKDKTRLLTEVKLPGEQFHVTLPQNVEIVGKKPVQSTERLYDPEEVMQLRHKIAFLTAELKRKDRQLQQAFKASKQNQSTGLCKNCKA